MWTIQLYRLRIHTCITDIMDIKISAGGFI